MDLKFISEVDEIFSVRICINQNIVCESENIFSNCIVYLPDKIDINDEIVIEPIIEKIFIDGILKKIRACLFTILSFIGIYLLELFLMPQSITALKNSLHFMSSLKITILNPEVSCIEIICNKSRIKNTDLFFYKLNVHNNDSMNIKKDITINYNKQIIKEDYLHFVRMHYMALTPVLLIFISIGLYAFFIENILTIIITSFLSIIFLSLINIRIYLNRKTYLKYLNYANKKNLLVHENERL